MIKGKLQYALKPWKLYVIFNELVCIAKIITQDDSPGEGQSFRIAVIDHALSLVILTCLPYLEEGRRRKDLFK